MNYEKQDLQATLNCLLPEPVTIGGDMLYLNSIGAEIELAACAQPSRGEPGEGGVPEGGGLDALCACEQSLYWATQSGFDCASEELIYFYHPDYLGSVEFVTDMRGEPYQFFLNTPWGENLENQFAKSYTSFSSRFRFNGKEWDEETGNYYYGVRYYDPKISVWLSVDAMAAKDHNFSLTPYHFVANNPLTFVDPDGNDWFVNEKTGETMYRPALGEEDAAILGKNMVWFAANADIQLDRRDQMNGQMVGNLEPGNFNVEGFNFKAGVSKKIMEKNGYKMVPTQVTRESNVLRISAGPAPPYMGGAIYTDQGFEIETWDEVTYAPENAYRSFLGQKREFFNWSHIGGASRVHQKHVESYSYESNNSVAGWLQGIVNPKFLENAYLFSQKQLQGISGVQKTVVKP